MTCEVLSDGAASAPFNNSNGVKQGCFLAPVTFNLFFACVLSYAVRWGPLVSAGWVTV